MKLRLVLIVSLLAVFSGTALAQSAGAYEIPRTEHGQPDLQGVWNFSSSTPMQRAERYGTQEFLTAEQVQEQIERQARMAARADAQEAELNLNPEAPPAGQTPRGYNTFWIEMGNRGDNVRTSHIVYPESGRVPAAVEGNPVIAGGLGPDISGERPVRFIVGGIAKNGPEDRGLSERCLVGFNAGPPFLPSLYNNNMQIIQSKDSFVIITEMIHDARIVPLVEMPELSDDIRLWSGDSRGYWEGDTLVVETNNFNGMQTSFQSRGTNFDMVLKEKFTRVAYDQVDYEFTIDDPSTYTDKITAIVPMSKVAGQIYEYACHEGNYGMINTMRGARYEERTESEASN
jgi:hypothetical protein|tara:strand:+ start:853 stop:1884 length:1032 start_codon:yes stop_codon:yes gene_type:complete